MSVSITSISPAQARVSASASTPSPYASVELSIWPASSRPAAEGDVTVADVSLTEVADRFGTPLYVLDEGEVRDRCRAYRTALPDADVVYAAKAFLSRAMARWGENEGLGLEVCSAGELGLAMTAGFPAQAGRAPGRERGPHVRPGGPAGRSGREGRPPRSAVPSRSAVVRWPGWGAANAGWRTRRPPPHGSRRVRRRGPTAASSGARIRPAGTWRTCRGGSRPARSA
ncbi:hypothetical protein [Streptomyces nojiriensis]|uniref:hypothetical protein n=1 Tax=Streptomyces nojiriensis TaxID=66374 RepID=UPI004063FF74